MDERVPFDELALRERADAWRRYLADTRKQAGERYEEIEPWAWQRLKTSLAASLSRLKARAG